MQEKANRLSQIDNEATNIIDLPLPLPKPVQQKTIVSKPSPHAVHAYSFKGMLSKVIAEPIEVAPECVRMTTETPVPEATVLLRIGGQVIASSGNMLGYSGAVKSGKSAATQITIAACINPDGRYLDPVHQMEFAPNANKRAIVHFDTEQSLEKHKATVCAITRRAGLKDTPAHLHSYNIRNLELNVYKETVLTICEKASEQHGGIQIVVIDGIADFINDVNNVEESHAITKFFMDLSAHYNTVVLSIIHTNPNGEKERGHLGSGMGRKCESLLSIKKDSGISYIEPKECRNAEASALPIIRFAYDISKGYHVPSSAEVGSTKDGVFQRKDTSSIEKRQIINACFAIQPEINYTDLVDFVKVNHEKMKGVSIGRDKAKTLVSFAIAEKWIVKQQGQKSPYVINRDHSD